MTTVSLAPWPTRCSSYSQLGQAGTHPRESSCGRQSELYLSAQSDNGNVPIRNGPVQLQNGTNEKEFGDEEVDLARVVDVRVAGSTVLGSTGRLFLP
jgi:hypothetical protein